MTHHLDSVDRAYAILGLRPGCRAAEIKGRHRALVKTWHPDRWAGDPISQREAAQRMRDINSAWQTLHDAAHAVVDRPASRTTAAVEDLTPPLPFGRPLKQSEIDAIVRAMKEESVVETVGRFLLWAFPLGVAFVISSGHGRYSSEFRIPPSQNEMMAATGLALFAVGVLVRRWWIKRH